MPVLAAPIEQAAPGVFRRVTLDGTARRGSQLCLSHPDAHAVMQALVARGVIRDLARQTSCGSASRR